MCLRLQRPARSPCSSQSFQAALLHKSLQFGVTHAWRPNGRGEGEQAGQGSAVVSGLSPRKILFSPASGLAAQGKARLARFGGPAQQHAPSARLG